MPKDSMCRRYHAVAAANLQRALAKYKIIFYENLIYANIVNITNILRYENLALHGMCLKIKQKVLYHTYMHTLV